MSTETIPACPLALTPADLSAWRDRALALDEAQRIEAHLANCSGCRARLAEYETIATGLRAIRVPDPLGGYGHSPRLQPHRAKGIRGGLPRLRLLGGMGALAAALLVALAFAQVFTSFGRHVSGLRTPTPTALSALQLAWKPATFPSGFAYDAGYPNLSIAPTDGNIAYACVLIPSGHGLAAQVWRTSDRGLGWTHVFSGLAPADANTCTVYADALDSRIAVVSAAWAFRTAPPSPNQSTSYATLDGGATWRQLAGHTLVTQPATVGSATYAIVRTQPGVGMGELVQMDLEVSRDDMKTWTPIDQAITAAKYTLRLAGLDPALRSFWLNRPLGELLVEASDPDQGNFHLWSSKDGGQHWHKLAPVNGTDFAVQAGDRGPSWGICAMRFDTATNQQTSALVCSTDGGQTWGERPPLILPFDNQAGKNPGPTTAYAYPYAIAADGAILATAARAQLPDGSLQGYTLYRLVPGATQWQSLGPIPEMQVIYASAPANGLLWALPGSWSVNGVLTGRVYTVGYP
jgi:hypothetical protein